MQAMQARNTELEDKVLSLREQIVQSNQAHSAAMQANAQERYKFMLREQEEYIKVRDAAQAEIDKLRAEIRTLTKRVKDYFDSIQAFQAKLDQVLADEKAAQDQKNQLEVKLAESNAELLIAKKSLAELKSDLEAVKTNQTSLVEQAQKAWQAEQDIKMHALQQEYQQALLDADASNAETVSAINLASEAQQEKYKDSLQELKDKLAAKERSAHNREEALKAKLEDSLSAHVVDREKLDVSRAEIEKLEVKTESLQTDKADLQEAVKSLQEEIAELQEKLEGQETAKQEALKAADLQSQKMLQTAESKAQQALTEAKLSAEAQIEQLTQDKDRMQLVHQTQIAELEERIAALQQNAQTQQAAIETQGEAKDPEQASKPTASDASREPVNEPAREQDETAGVSNAEKPRKQRKSWFGKLFARGSNEVEQGKFGPFEDAAEDIALKGKKRLLPQNDVPAPDDAPQRQAKRIRGEPKTAPETETVPPKESSPPVQETAAEESKPVKRRRGRPSKKEAPASPSKAKPLAIQQSSHAIKKGRPTKSAAARKAAALAAEAGETSTVVQTRRRPATARPRAAPKAKAAKRVKSDGAGPSKSATSKSEEHEEVSAPKDKPSRAKSAKVVPVKEEEEEADQVDAKPEDSIASRVRRRHH